MGLAEAVKGRPVVLLSGGYDSAYCAVRAAASGQPRPVCVFFDYGQSYLVHEDLAATYCATTLGLELLRATVPAISSSGGVFENRNEVFISHVLLSRPASIYFGCRNPLAMFDRYGDSNWQWARRMQKRSGVTIVTPCVCLPKFAIRRAVVRAGLNLDLLYSTEGIHAHVPG